MRKNELDLWFMEDLGCVVRGAEAVRLLGIGVDHGTRGISPNDCIDTADPSWEEDAISACRDHVGHNAHTSKRIKHKLMNRFKKSGGATARPVAGYIVPPGAKTYGEWQREQDALPIICQGLRILDETLNGEAVAEYFNKVPWKGGVGFPPGPYCRKKLKDGTLVRATRWDGRMALRYSRNRILGGAPSRGHRYTVKHHETGRRVSMPNPNGPCYIDCPHLAHVNLAEQDAVIAKLKAGNGKLGRKPVNGVDPLFRVSRTDSRFPSGPGRCWYCGHHSVWGGNGITCNLMCSGAREWKCWCSVGYDGTLATQKVVRLISDVLHGLEGFDAQFRELVRRARQGDGNLEQRRTDLRRDEEALEVRRNNVVESIAKVGPKPVVLRSLAAVEAEEVRLAGERQQIVALASRRLEVPESTAELRRLFEEKCGAMASDSPELNRLLRTLVPRFDVHLVRLLDGGHLLPRARLTLSLDGIAPDARYVPGLCELLQTDRTVDLFDPPQRETIRERAVALAARGNRQRDIAIELDVTQPAVQDALALQAKMRERGFESPYVLVTERRRTTQSCGGTRTASISPDLCKATYSSHSDQRPRSE